MTWEDALDVIVFQTGHSRYRELCADSHPDREAWRARMLEKAGVAPPRAGKPLVPSRPTIPLEESIRLLKIVKACLFRQTKGCGCSGARCALRGHVVVSHVDCFDCARTYG